MFRHTNTPQGQPRSLLQLPSTGSPRSLPSPCTMHGPGKSGRARTRSPDACVFLPNRASIESPGRLVGFRCRQTLYMCLPVARDLQELGVPWFPAYQVLTVRQITHRDRMSRWARNCSQIGKKSHQTGKFIPLRPFQPCPRCGGYPHAGAGAWNHSPRHAHRRRGCPNAGDARGPRHDRRTSCPPSSGRHA